MTKYTEDAQDSGSTFSYFNIEIEFGSTLMFSLVSWMTNEVSLSLANSI